MFLLQVPNSETVRAKSIEDNEIRFSIELSCVFLKLHTKTETIQFSFSPKNVKPSPLCSTENKSRRINRARTPWNLRLQEYLRRRWRQRTTGMNHRRGFSLRYKKSRSFLPRLRATSKRTSPRSMCEQYTEDYCYYYLLVLCVKIM